MSLGELQARLNVQLTDLKTIFEAGGVQEHSLLLMDTMILKKNHADCLALIEGFDRSMAFVDHDEVCNRLVTCWGLVVDSLNAERKNIKKKIAALKEDKKSDPEVLARQEDLLQQLYIKRANAIINSTRFKAMAKISIKEFQANPVMDTIARYNEVMAETKK